MNIKVDNKRVILITIGVVALLAGIFGATYAFFSAEVINPNGSSMEITTANLGIVNFIDGPEILLEDMYPGTDEMKEFTIERAEATINDEVFYNIVLNVRSNTLTAVADGEFVYYLVGTTEGTGDLVLVYGAEVPETTTTLGTGSLVGNELHTYYFSISLNETGSNQNPTRGTGFNGYLQVELLEGESPTNQYCFAFSENGTISGYFDYENGNSSNPECPKDVVIPNTLYGFPVTSISEMAFMSKGLMSVTIPDSVISIGYAAFNDNELLGSQAFIYARTDVNSDGVAEIDDTKVVSYGGAVRSGLVIPDNVESIEMAAFGLCYLTSVTIPTSVTNIGDFAFDGNNLTSITIPTSVTSIGSLAFAENSLTSITIPASVTSIGDYAFNPNLLTDVCIKGKSYWMDFTSYGGEVFGWDTGYDDTNITWNCTN